MSTVEQFIWVNLPSMQHQSDFGHILMSQRVDKKKRKEQGVAKH
jgi:hypothetical protein